MKQRLGIASTLLRDPELIILDEPTNGLDPAGTKEIRDLIPQFAHESRVVLLSSHLLLKWKWSATMSPLSSRVR